MAGERAERSAFCERRGLAIPSFYAWRRRLQQRAADAPAIVPVQVVADAPPGQASALEVVLTDGRTVRVAPGFDAATLRQPRILLSRLPDLERGGSAARRQSGPNWP